MLIIFLIIKFRKIFKRYYSLELNEAFKKLVLKFKYVLPFFMLSYISSNNTVTEFEKISFSIIKKEARIGFIDIEKTSFNYNTTYVVNSEVNAKVIINFNAIGREKSVYKADTLIYSSLYRKLNDKVKLNQCLYLNDGKYLLKINDKQEVLHFDVINRNLVTLFFFEPKGIFQVYSDKYNEMVKITPISKGKYKVVLPDNSTNIYHYEKGKCILIEVEGSFFKVKLIPNNKIYSFENI